MPNSNWTNEPYGLTYYDGKYHLFFQKNPSGLWLHFMHWGHLSSPDLVHWKEEKIALGPDPGFDDFGMWSGTTIKDANGVPVIFYTGVDLGRAGIGVAFPKDKDLIEWEKYDKNPVVPNTPSGYHDFRDPFLWQDKGNYYMIVGSGFAGDGGGALITYKSTDLLKWTKITNLHSSTKVTESGFFWEMSLFYPLNDKGDYILAITPLYKNKGADVIYWIGKWENEKFTPYFESPKIFEASKDNMLAPAIGTDEAGRITYIGIVPETRNVADQIKSGWRHIFSLPRVVRLLQDSTIGQYPHPHLCRLKENEETILNRPVSENNSNNLAEFGGNQIALSYRIKADSASQFSLQVLKNASGNQFASMVFDLSRNLVALDTRNAHVQSAAKEYTAYEYLFHKDEIKVEIFIDRSVVEVFIDNLLVVSMRCYPAETSQLVDLLVTAGSVEILEAKQWTMRCSGDNTGTEVCEPENLPTKFRKMEKKVVTGLNSSMPEEIQVYPNPAKQTLKIASAKPLTNSKVTFYSMTGKKVKSMKLGSYDTTINISDLPEGLYVIAITNSSISRYFKIYIHQ